MRRLSFLLCALVLSACSDAVDKAAKKRIFSPEDPPKAVSSASEKLPPEQVASDGRIARRILGMGAAEATERIGPHAYSAKVSFEWIGNGRTVKLVESRTLAAGPGGVAGDFRGVIENSRDQGLEVLRVKGQVFARSRYGKFRQRLRDRGMAEREREEIFGAIRDFDALFHGRLKLSEAGTVTHEGRTAWKYSVSLGPAAESTDERPLPPRLVQRDGGVDETTRRRLAFFERRTPRALEGEVWVDAQTSVVVKARLTGRLGVATDEGEAELRMVVETAMTEIGKDPGLTAPEEFLPDEDKPIGIAEALDRFGIPRGGAKPDAGVPTDEPPDE